MFGPQNSLFVGNNESKIEDLIRVKEFPIHEGSTVFNPNSSLFNPSVLVTVPLAFPYANCNKNVSEPSSQSNLQVAAPHLYSSSIMSSCPEIFAPPANKQPALEKEHLVGFSSQFQCLPPKSKKRKTKLEDQRSMNFTTGLSKWYLKRRTEKMLAISASKNRLQRTQKALKRLTNYCYVQRWKMDSRHCYEEREAVRESKLEMLQRKGIKAPRKIECTLWNCPRRKYKRMKRPFMPLDLTRRSHSSLSNLSKKSRSPIVFSRSP